MPFDDLVVVARASGPTPGHGQFASLPTVEVKHVELTGGGVVAHGVAFVRGGVGEVGHGLIFGVVGGSLPANAGF